MLYTMHRNRYYCLSGVMILLGRFYLIMDQSHGANHKWSLFVHTVLIYCMLGHKLCTHAFDFTPQGTFIGDQSFTACCFSELKCYVLLLCSNFLTARNPKENDTRTKNEEKCLPSELEVVPPSPPVAQCKDKKSADKGKNQCVCVC